MFWLIAWRNIWAKKRQSILTIALSVFCAIFLVFMLAFMHGQHKKMIKDSVEIYTGYLQITGKNYQDYQDYNHLIYDLNKVKQVVSEFPEIKSAGERFQTFALFAREEDSIGGMLIGINPVLEENLSRIKSAIIKGEYLDKGDNPYCIIGKKLAKRLRVGLGDELIYLSQAIDMSMAADILIIKGIFFTGSQIDSNGVFVNKTYIDKVFLTENIASHYVLLPKEKFRDSRLQKLVIRLNKKLAGTETEAVSWKVPLKSILQLVKVDSAFGYFSYGILVVVIFFVVMIFFLISIFQRTREIGVLRAVGTKPKQIFLMLIGEAFILGAIAVIIGGVIGGCLVYYYHVNPIQIVVSQEILEQYQQWGIVDMTFPTVFSYMAILNNCLFVLLLNVFAVLYPAIKVNMYKPIDVINYV